MVEWLLARGADRHAKNKDGQTPLQVADRQAVTALGGKLPRKRRRAKDESEDEDDDGEMDDFIVDDDATDDDDDDDEDYDDE